MEQDTKKLHALELRLPIAENFLRFLDNVGGYLEQIPQWENQKRIEFADAVLSKLEEIKVPVGMKTYATHFQNEFESARDVFLENRFNRTKLSFENFDKIREVTRKLISSLNVKIADLKENGIDSSHVKDEAHAVETTLQNVKGEMKRMHRIADKPYIICRAPVIPVTNNAFFILDALRESFKISVVGGYPILHDQLIVGLNRGYMRKMSQTISLNDIIEKLEARKGVRYIKIMNRGVSSTTSGYGVVWYWLMPEDEANRFRKCFRNYGVAGLVGTKTLGLQGISLRDWGFADGY